MSLLQALAPERVAGIIGRKTAMNGHFETHWDMLVLTPAIGITAGHCEDPECHESHWRVNLTWLFWTVEVAW